jgi:hypothetical protein
VIAGALALSCGSEPEAQSIALDLHVVAPLGFDSDSFPAGVAVPLTIQLSDGNGGTLPRYQIRASATTGTITPTVDTTDAIDEIHSVWRPSGAVGPQSILFEVYRLDNGERVTGFGFERPVRAGVAAHIPFRADSVPLFVGDSYPLFSQLTAVVTDSFGNPTDRGPFTVTPSGGTWVITGDTVIAGAPFHGRIIVTAGLAVDTLKVRAYARYLNVYQFQFACNDNPPATRGSDGVVAGFDISSSGTMTVAYPGDPLYYANGAFAGEFELVLAANNHYVWTDSVVEDHPLTMYVGVEHWAPDTVVYHNAGTGLRAGENIVGGNWCVGWPTAGTVVPVTLHP